MAKKNLLLIIQPNNAGAKQGVLVAARCVPARSVLNMGTACWVIIHGVEGQGRWVSRCKAVTTSGSVAARKINIKKKKKKKKKKVKRLSLFLSLYVCVCVCVYVCVCMRVCAVYVYLCLSVSLCVCVCVYV